MSLDGLHGLSHRFGRVFESLKPCVQVDATLADGVERLLGHPPPYHLVMEMVETHVAGPTIRMSHHHDLLHAQFVDGHDEASHGRVERRNHQSACVLDHLRIAIPQSQCCRKQFGESGVHAREHSQFFVGIFVGNELLVSLRFHELFVELDNLVYHRLK